MQRRDLCSTGQSEGHAVPVAQHRPGPAQVDCIVYQLLDLQRSSSQDHYKINEEQSSEDALKVGLHLLVFLVKVNDECRRESGIIVGSSLTSNNSLISKQPERACCKFQAGKFISCICC